MASRSVTIRASKNFYFVQVLKTCNQMVSIISKYEVIDKKLEIPGQERETL